MKIILENKKIYHGNLVLVNAQYPFKDINTNNFKTITPRFPNIFLQYEASNALNLILRKISANNAIIPVSGYRSIEEQSEIYYSSLKDNGQEYTKKFVALPHHSEHQTGLAIDLALNQKNIDFICPNFPYEGISNNFRKAAPYYGFIERYQKEKEKITSIAHEPWHFRYVGYPHSEIIVKKHFALEEYITFLKTYSEHNRFIYLSKNKSINEIYFVPAIKYKTIITLPKTSNYQISGNNIDGFIITLWRTNI